MGSMPGTWSGTLDRGSQIQSVLRLVFLALLLLWSESWAVGTGAVSFNKAAGCGHLVGCRCCAANPFSAGRGGEGKRCSSGVSSASSSWRLESSELPSSSWRAAEEVPWFVEFQRLVVASNGASSATSLLPHKLEGWLSILGVNDARSASEAKQLVFSPLAGHGGEGRRRCYCFSSRIARWESDLLQSRATYMAAFFVVVIFGQCGGPYATSMPEAFWILRRSSTARPRQVVRPRRARAGRSRGFEHPPLRSRRLKRLEVDGDWWRRLPRP